jgi:multidrug resistance efflux pump
VKGPATTSNAASQETFQRNGAGPAAGTAVVEPAASAPAPAEPKAPEPAAAPAGPAAAPNGQAPGGQAPGKRKMKRSTRRALAIIAVLAVLAALGFGGAYFLYSRNFVSTDNAQVDGDKISINAPATGTLIDWRGQQGAQLTRNELVGRVKMGTSGAQPQVIIKSPGTGTIAANNVVEGQWVTSGTELATAYDFSKIYVTARVDETDIGGVHLGAQVDIDVDAYSGAPITGVVTEIQGAAANQFSLFPESNSTGNFQKVTQVIPVRIAFTNTDGKYLVPGMNVTVHIHKQQ